MKFYIRAHIAPLEYEFNDDDWDYYPSQAGDSLVERHATKAKNWCQGSFQSGPVILERALGEETTRITWRRNHDISRGTMNGFVYEFLYDCRYERDNERPYAVYAYYRRSTQRVDIDFIQAAIQITILEDNSLEEIIHKIVNDFNSNTNAGDAAGIKMKYEYDNQKGSITLAMFHYDEEIPWQFRMYTTDHVAELINDDKNINSLLQFLNQDDGFMNYRELVDLSYHKSFESEVWDRKRVQFHATFSDARNRYIGSNGDRYDSPSKLYRYVLTDPMFYIRFTTDGRTNFIPRYCSIIIELCFILNY
jgi:hypothetical protein